MRVGHGVIRTLGEEDDGGGSSVTVTPPPHSGKGRAPTTPSAAGLCGGQVSREEGVAGP